MGRRRASTRRLASMKSDHVLLLREAHHGDPGAESRGDGGREAPPGEGVGAAATWREARETGGRGKRQSWKLGCRDLVQRTVGQGPIGGRGGDGSSHSKTIPAVRKSAYPYPSRIRPGQVK